MSRDLVTGPPGFVRRRMILQLLAAGREVRAMAGSPTRAGEVRAFLDIGDVQPAARVSFIAANPDQGADRLDAAAGCEFVDDRIHLLE